jgi:hypothetical protein
VRWQPRPPPAVLASGHFIWEVGWPPGLPVTCSCKVREMSEAWAHQGLRTQAGVGSGEAAELSRVASPPIISNHL